MYVNYIQLLIIHTFTRCVLSGTSATLPLATGGGMVEHYLSAVFEPISATRVGSILGSLEKTSLL